VKDIDANDPRLEQLARIQSILTPAIGAGSSGRANSVQTSAGISLIVWSHDAPKDGSSAGVVIDSSQTGTLIREAFPKFPGNMAMTAEIRDGRGAEVWRLNDSPLPTDAVVQPLSAVDGWTLRLSQTGPSSRSWWVYGLVVLPIALLALGLVLTSRVVRREVALARRQAEFTAAVTHEFKSPITSLRLLMERIASGRVVGGPALAEYHDAITRETNRLDGLVNRLLDAQQIQAGRRSHAPAIEEIAPMIAASVHRFRTQAAEKNIDLQTDVPESPIELPLDRHSVSDALDNLIDNAIKYSASGTAVTVTASATDGQVAIAVRDQGAGIHRHDLAHVFEPYYRGRLGDRENVRGTGLGLALVQAAAVAHGGSVDVVSTPGEGSTFTLRFPLGKSS
jgi:signal transduction histidine kinase